MRTRAALAVDECLYVFTQRAVARCFPRPVIVDVDVGALLAYAEAGPNLLATENVWEGVGAGGIEKLSVRIARAQPANTNEGDLVTKFLFDLYDRRGFATSKRSPGRP